MLPVEGEVGVVVGVGLVDTDGAVGHRDEPGSARRRRCAHSKLEDPASRSHTAALNAPTHASDPSPASGDDASVGYRRWTRSVEARRCWTTACVQGRWRALERPEDVLDLMDTGAEGVIALVRDAGATFLALIFHELAGVVCTGGTVRSHIGIVSREFEIPCVMGTAFAAGEPADGDLVEIDCSGEIGVVQPAEADLDVDDAAVRQRANELIRYHGPISAALTAERTSLESATSCDAYIIIARAETFLRYLDMVRRRRRPAGRGDRPASPGARAARSTAATSGPSSTSYLLPQDPRPARPVEGRARGPARRARLLGPFLARAYRGDDGTRQRDTGIATPTTTRSSPRCWQAPRRWTTRESGAASPGSAPRW